ncbi:MAG: phage holin family protein [Candidatus Abawacabacteria bacterium]|nr:phage holin family protein [Candidatus Abawacabacteria bacterium]
MLIARFVWNWIMNSLVLGLLVVLIPSIQIHPGLSAREQIRLFLLGGLILGLVNSIIKPLLKLFSLPLILLTGGLFLIVINMIVLAIVTWLVPEIVIPDIMTYIIAAVLLGILNTIENLFFV